MAIQLSAVSTPAILVRCPALKLTPKIVVPMGFLPEDTPAEPDGPHTFHPTPGMPIGMHFIGAKFSERDLLRYAFVVEQETKVRLQRKAYDAAIPKTQLIDVVGAKRSV